MEPHAPTAAPAWRPRLGDPALARPGLVAALALGEVLRPGEPTPTLAGRACPEAEAWPAVAARCCASDWRCSSRRCAWFSCCSPCSKHANGFLKAVGRRPQQAAAPEAALLLAGTPKALTANARVVLPQSTAVPQHRHHGSRAVSSGSPSPEHGAARHPQPCVQMTAPWLAQRCPAGTLQCAPPAACAPPPAPHQTLCRHPLQCLQGNACGYGTS